MIQLFPSQECLINSLISILFLDFKIEFKFSRENLNKKIITDKNRQNAGRSVPAQGLFLMEVNYEL